MKSGVIMIMISGITDMEHKQESLSYLLSVSDWKRKGEMREYAFNLLSRDLSHIQLQADMRKANSAELSKLLDEVSEALARYR